MWPAQLLRGLASLILAAIAVGAIIAVFVFGGVFFAVLGTGAIVLVLFGGLTAGIYEALTKKDP